MFPTDRLVIEEPTLLGVIELPEAPNVDAVCQTVLAAVSVAVGVLPVPPTP